MQSTLHKEDGLYPTSQSSRCGLAGTATFPSLYVNGENHLHFINSRTLYRHNDEENPGKFYGELYNFELEFVDNTGVGQ